MSKRIGSADLRANVEALYAGEIDHDTFTARQREMWDAIKAQGRRSESQILRTLRG